MPGLSPSRALSLRFTAASLLVGLATGCMESMPMGHADDPSPLFLFSTRADGIRTDLELP